MLGINLHIALITPLIVGLYRIGAAPAARIIEAYSYPAARITIFVTGCALTLWSRAGFIGAARLPRRYSGLTLIGAAAAISWAFLIGGNGFVAVGLPILALFVLRRALRHRAA